MQQWCGGEGRCLILFTLDLTTAQTRLIAATTKLGSRAIDGRSSLFYAVKKWRRELVNDLGGEGNISTQQSALIVLLIKSKLLLDSIDAWLLTWPTLINKRKKSLFASRPPAPDLSRWVARSLAQLGLEHRHKAKTLDDILNEEESVTAATLKQSTNERRNNRTRSKKRQSAEQKQPQDDSKEQQFFLLFHKRPQIHKEMIHDVPPTKPV